MQAEAQNLVESLAVYHSKLFQGESLSIIATLANATLNIDAETEWAIFGLYSINRVLSRVLSKCSVREDVLLVFACYALSHPREWGLPEGQLDDLKKLICKRGDEYDSAIKLDPTGCIYLSLVLGTNLLYDGDSKSGEYFTAHWKNADRILEEYCTEIQLVSAFKDWEHSRDALALRQAISEAEGQTKVHAVTCGPTLKSISPILGPWAGGAFAVFSSLAASCGLSTAVVAIIPDSLHTFPLVSGSLTALGIFFGSYAATVLTNRAVLSGVCAGFLPLMLGVLESVRNDQYTGFGCTLAAGVLLLASAGSRCASRPIGATSSLEGIAKKHFVWVWLAFYLWAYEIPFLAYFFWLTIGSLLNQLLHPALWFDGYLDLKIAAMGALGLFGATAWISGIALSIQALANIGKKSIWKRVLLFSVGTGIFVPVLAHFLLACSISLLSQPSFAVGYHMWWKP